MTSIDDLYSKLNGSPDPCAGCTILKTPGEHCIKEKFYVEEEIDILFINGAFVNSMYGGVMPITKQEENYIAETLDRYSRKVINIQYTAAVKCPSVQESSMATEDFHICRKHIMDTIDKLNPKIIITLGNLALKMVTKKSGIFSKRGTEIQIEVNGKEYKVIPTLGAGHVIAEPRLKFYFNADLRNTLDKYMGGVKPVIYEYEYADTLEKLKEFDFLKTTNNPIAVDIETTGFDFRRDKIQTISISTKGATVVIPLFHKDSPFKDDPIEVIMFLREVLESNGNIKVFHNAPFDCKFIRGLGIIVSNIRDTSSMAHLINEDMEKKLISLVKLYLPSRLETL
jgi:uracil-DNA glycosylase family 4